MSAILSRPQCVNSSHLRPGQNGRHFADYVFHAVIEGDGLMSLMSNVEYISKQERLQISTFQ